MVDFRMVDTPSCAILTGHEAFLALLRYPQTPRPVSNRGSRLLENRLRLVFFAIGFFLPLPSGLAAWLCVLVKTRSYSRKVFHS